MKRKRSIDSATPEVSPVLRVSLVSGMEREDRVAICRLLAGITWPAQPAADLSDDSDDSSDFALHLADSMVDSARSGTVGHAFIELEEAADVVEIGLVMESVFEYRRKEGPPVELHDLVSVVSVLNIHRWLLSASPSPATDFDTAERLAAQLEFSTVIVLSDADAAHSDTVRRVLRFLRRVNPTSQIIRQDGIVDRVHRASSGRGCARRLARQMGWMLALAGHGAAPLPGNTTDVVVFRDPRPFHPGRLSTAIRLQLTPNLVGRIARSHGLIQLATRADQIGSWKSAGDTVRLDPTSINTWDSQAPLGQEMVFFGEQLRQDRIVATLAHCLLTDQELLAGPMCWARYDDPFPSWPAELRH